MQLRWRTGLKWFGFGWILILIYILQSQMNWYPHLIQGDWSTINYHVSNEIAMVVILFWHALLIGFLHWSLGHVLGNVIWLWIIGGLLIWKGISGRFLVIFWWTSNTLVVYLALLIVHWGNLILHFNRNQTPIFGASVGLYALLGLLLIKTIEDLWQSHFKLHAWLMTWLMIGLSLFMVMGKYDLLWGVTGSQLVVTTFTVWVHLLGFVSGILFEIGWGLKVRWMHDEAH